MAHAELPQPQAGDHEIDIRAVLRVAVKRRWLVVGTLCSCLFVGLMATLQATRIYRAEATVVIDPSAPDVLGDVQQVYDPARGGGWRSGEDYYMTQLDIIRSRPVLARVAQRLGLSVADMLRELEAGVMVSSTLGAVAQGAGGSRPTEELPPHGSGAARQTPEKGAAAPVPGRSADSARPRGLPAPVPPTLQGKLDLLGLDSTDPADVLAKKLTDFDVTAALRSFLTVQPVKSSRLVTVSVEHPVPQAASTLANAVVDAYLDYTVDEKIDVTRSAVDWLSDQMNDLKARLEQSEIDLHAFKRDNNVVSVSMETRQTIISETLSQLNRELSAVRASRLALESRRDQLGTALRAGEDPEYLGEVAGNQLVQALKTRRSGLRQESSELAGRYTTEHPQLLTVTRKLELVEADLQAEIQRVVSSVEKEYRIKVENERRLSIAIETVKAEALELNKKEIDYNRLRRERDNNQALYELVLKRYKEADLTRLLRVNNVRRLEAAMVPKDPVRPRPLLNMLLALLVGVGLSIGAVFLAEQLDNTLRTQNQVEELLGIPFLGLVPAIAPDGQRAGDGNDAVRDRHVIAHPRSAVAEACRTLRSNLLFMGHERPAQCLLVTSSSPREGKTTTAINLAITLAQSGARTLLVDTDLRRPRLHKSFSVPNDVGISTAILGTASLDDAVRKTEQERLEVVPCGPIPPNPAELLHSDDFRELLETLRARYDRIIFDSPPVIAVADASVLSTVVDGVVLIGDAQKTAWQAAAQAVQRLERVGARVLGMVLNKVVLDDPKYGGYYQYYYYRYGADAEGKKTPARKAS